MPVSQACSGPYLYRLGAFAPFSNWYRPSGRAQLSDGSTKSELEVNRFSNVGESESSSNEAQFAVSDGLYDPVVMAVLAAPVASALKLA